MSRFRFIDTDGRRYLWRHILELRVSIADATMRRGRAELLRALPSRATSPFRPKRNFLSLVDAQEGLRFGSPRRSFPLATPRSPRGKGAAAAAPQ
jgi:hypothetical protein